jgi:glycosyltransferase involved in cell wall biosynthesis
MKLSVIIPAHNEEGSIGKTVESLIGTLTAEGIDHEVLVVNDGSTDRTEAILEGLQCTHPTWRYINNEAPSGFDLAVRKGLDHFSGDAVARHGRWLRRPETQVANAPLYVTNRRRPRDNEDLVRPTLAS